MSTQTAAVNSQTPDAAAAFTNERYIGSIEITKALAGTGSDKGYGKTFLRSLPSQNIRFLSAAQIVDEIAVRR